MAQTIPDKLPSKATKGELLLFDILKRLPDQAVVYHEPVIDNRHPDFVVILPELGVLLIEVKDWKFSTILGGDSRAVRLRAGEREVSAAHPLRQVRDYKIRLMVRCRNHPYFSRLIHASGPHMGYFKFPFGASAFFPISRGINWRRFRRAGRFSRRRPSSPGINWPPGRIFRPAC